MADFSSRLNGKFELVKSFLKDGKLSKDEAKKLGIKESEISVFMQQYNTGKLKVDGKNVNKNNTFNVGKKFKAQGSKTGRYYKIDEQGKRHFYEANGTPMDQAKWMEAEYAHIDKNGKISVKVQQKGFSSRAKDIGKSAWNTIKSTVCDEKGNFSWKKAGETAAICAGMGTLIVLLNAGLVALEGACAASGALAPLVPLIAFAHAHLNTILIGVFGAMVIGKAIGGASQMANAQTEKDYQKGTQKLGEAAGEGAMLMLMGKIGSMVSKACAKIPGMSKFAAKITAAFDKMLGRADKGKTKASSSNQPKASEAKRPAGDKSTTNVSKTDTPKTEKSAAKSDKINYNEQTGNYEVTYNTPKGQQVAKFKSKKDAERFCNAHDKTSNTISRVKSGISRVTAKVKRTKNNPETAKSNAPQTAKTADAAKPELKYNEETGMYEVETVNGNEIEWKMFKTKAEAEEFIKSSNSAKSNAPQTAKMADAAKPELKYNEETGMYEVETVNGNEIEWKMFKTKTEAEEFIKSSNSAKSADAAPATEKPAAETTQTETPQIGEQPTSEAAQAEPAAAPQAEAPKTSFWGRVKNAFTPKSRKLVKDFESRMDNCKTLEEYQDVMSDISKALYDGKISSKQANKLNNRQKPEAVELELELFRLEEAATNKQTARLVYDEETGGFKVEETNTDIIGSRAANFKTRTEAEEYLDRWYQDGQIQEWFSLDNSRSYSVTIGKGNEYQNYTFKTKAEAERFLELKTAKAADAAPATEKPAAETTQTETPQVGEQPTSEAAQADPAAAPQAKAPKTSFLGRVKNAFTLKSRKLVKDFESRIDNCKTNKEYQDVMTDISNALKNKEISPKQAMKLYKHQKPEAVKLERAKNVQTQLNRQKAKVREDIDEIRSDETIQDAINQNSDAVQKFKEAQNDVRQKAAQVKLKEDEINAKKIDIANKQIAELQKYIQGRKTKLEKDKNLKPENRQKLLNEIETANKKIEDLRQLKISDKNPEIETLQKELTTLKSDLKAAKANVKAASKSADAAGARVDAENAAAEKRLAADAKTKEIDEQIAQNKKEIEALQKQLKNVNKQIETVEKEPDSSRKSALLNTLKTRAESLSARLARLNQNPKRTAILGGGTVASTRIFGITENDEQEIPAANLKASAAAVPAQAADKTPAEEETPETPTPSEEDVSDETSSTPTDAAAPATDTTDESSDETPTGSSTDPVSEETSSGTTVPLSNEQKDEEDSVATSNGDPVPVQQESGNEDMNHVTSSPESSIKPQGESDTEEPKPFEEKTDITDEDNARFKTRKINGEKGRIVKIKDDDGNKHYYEASDDKTERSVSELAIDRRGALKKNRFYRTDNSIQGEIDVKSVTIGDKVQNIYSSKTEPNKFYIMIEKDDIYSQGQEVVKVDGKWIIKE